MPCVENPYKIHCFQPEARAVLHKYQHRLAEMCDTEASEVIVGIYCKLETYLIRFCLILQLARQANTYGFQQLAIEVANTVWKVDDLLIKISEK